MNSTSVRVELSHVVVMSVGSLAAVVITAAILRRPRSNAAERACPQGRVAVAAGLHWRRGRSTLLALRGELGDIEDMGDRQIAGHKKTGERPDQLGMFVLPPKFILKPLQEGSARGEREVSFYEEIEVNFALLLGVRFFLKAQRAQGRTK